MFVKSVRSFIVHISSVIFLPRRSVSDRLRHDVKCEARPRHLTPALGRRHFIQHHFETQLARNLISGEITDGSTVRAELKNGPLTLLHL
jgi:hypothetical protein